MKNLVKNRRTIILVGLSSVLLGLSWGVVLLNKFQPFSPSFVRVYLEGSQIKLQFSLQGKDQGSFSQFSRNLGIPQLASGVFLEVNSGSKKYLNNLLPVKLNLRITPKRVDFYSTGTTLRSTLVGSENQLATLSGKLDLKSNSNRDFSLEIDNPADLVKEATLSGQIYLSKQFDPLLVLGKIAKISMRVNGSYINGKIILK